MANFYAKSSNFEKADELYLKSYRLAKANFGDKSKEVDKVEDSRICLNKDEKKRNTIFDEEVNKLFGIVPYQKGEVVNGKAKNLIKPPYPKEAREKRLAGTVKIQVRINEIGNVIEARSVCGDGILESASESAARLSKFSPTLLNGIPVQVKGIIIYNFTAQ